MTEKQRKAFERATADLKAQQEAMRRFGRAMREFADALPRFVEAYANAAYTDLKRQGLR